MKANEKNDYSFIPEAVAIMRHGETEANRARIIQGWNDSPLSQNGRKIVERTAKKIKGSNIDKIFSSDLKRTKETAAIVANSLNIPINFKRGLREQNFGDYEGKPYTQLFRDMKQANKSFDTFEPKNGESGLEFRERILSCLAEIIDESPGKSLLLITHGGVIQIILKEIFSDQYTFEKYKASFQNSAVTYIQNKNIRFVNIIDAN